MTQISNALMQSIACSLKIDASTFDSLTRDEQAPKGIQTNVSILKMLRIFSDRSRSRAKDKTNLLAEDAPGLFTLTTPFSDNIKAVCLCMDMKKAVKNHQMPISLISKRNHIAVFPGAMLKKLCALWNHDVQSASLGYYYNGRAASKDLDAVMLEFDCIPHAPQLDSIARRFTVPPVSWSDGYARHFFSGTVASTKKEDRAWKRHESLEEITSDASDAAGAVGRGALVTGKFAGRAALTPAVFLGSPLWLPIWSILNSSSTFDPFDDLTLLHYLS